MIPTPRDLEIARKILGMVATPAYGNLVNKISNALAELREKCAKVAEDSGDCCHAGDDHVFHASESIATAIRELGGKGG